VATSSGSGSTSTTREVSAAVVAVEKAAEMRTAKEVVAVKAAEEATTAMVAADKAAMMKAATNKAAVVKVVADKATATKVAEEAMEKAAADAAVMKTADQGATTPKTTVGLGGSDSGPSPTLAVGVQESSCEERLHSSFQAVPHRLETAVCRATV
jgi:membrane protein involved in colicin uptake